MNDLRQTELLDAVLRSAIPESLNPEDYLWYSSDKYFKDRVILWIKNNFPSTLNFIDDIEFMLWLNLNGFNPINPIFNLEYIFHQLLEMQPEDFFSMEIVDWHIQILKEVYFDYLYKGAAKPKDFYVELRKNMIGDQRV